MGDVTMRVMQNGLKIPGIGIGTWSAPDSAVLDAALDVALECGYRHIDTAYVYGTEKAVGRTLKKWFASGKLKREEIFITTKLPMYGIHEDRVDHYMEKSLKNLQLDYVDLYLIHFAVGTNLEGKDESDYLNANPEKVTDHIKIWKKMEEQVDAGKAKSIGLSNFNEKQIEKIWNNSRIKPACLQIELHLFLDQPNLVNYCKEKKIAVVAYSPLGTPSYKVYFEKMGRECKPQPNVMGDPVVKAIAAKHKKTTAQIALRYLIERGIVPIPKSINPSRVKENFDVFNFRLDADDIAKLKNLDAGEVGRVCDFIIFPGITEHPEYPFPK